MEVPTKYNETASGILWTAFALYVISFFLPVFTVVDIFDFIWVSFHYSDFLNGVGIIIYLAGVVLVGLGAYFTTKGMSVKRYALGSLIPMAIVMIIGSVQMNDFAHYNVSTGIGLWSNIFGMILALIGGMSSNKIIAVKPKQPKILYAVHPQEYQQQQGYSQPGHQQQPSGHQQQPSGYQQQPTIKSPEKKEMPLSEERVTNPKNFCGSCGNKTETDSIFCENCGSKY